MVFITHNERALEHQGAGSFGSRANRLRWSSRQPGNGRHPAQRTFSGRCLLFSCRPSRARERVPFAAGFPNPSCALCSFWLLSIGCGIMARSTTFWGPWPTLHRHQVLVCFFVTFLGRAGRRTRLPHWGIGVAGKVGFSLLILCAGAFSNTRGQPWLENAVQQAQTLQVNLAGSSLLSWLCVTCPFASWPSTNLLGAGCAGYSLRQFPRVLFVPLGSLHVAMGLDGSFVHARLAAPYRA